jgi:hypothetical protein
VLDFYRRLTAREKAIVWVAAVVLIVLVVVLGNEYQGVAAEAQVAAATGTLILAGLAFAQVRELRETRIAQERPQVIVDADQSDPPLLYIVVRNIGKGAAKDIIFDFSAPLASPASEDPHTDIVPINELPFFAQGVDYLAPGTEFSFFWGSMISLGQFLKERSLQDGITITSRYKSLAGEPYETRWIVNPLLLWGRGYIREEGIKDLIKVVKDMQKDIHSVISPWPKELMVSTETEREERRRKRDQEGKDDG